MKYFLPFSSYIFLWCSCIEFVCYIFFCHILNDRHQEVEEGPPRKHLVLQKSIDSIQNDLIYTSANQAYPSYADDLSISNTYANMNSRIPSSALSPYGYSSIIPAHDSLTGPTVPPPIQEYLETETSTEGSDYYTAYSDL